MLEFSLTKPFPNRNRKAAPRKKTQLRHQRKHFLYQSHENAFAFHHPLARRDALDGEKSKSLCVTRAGGRANHTLKNAFLLACFPLFFRCRSRIVKIISHSSRGGGKKSVSLFRREEKKINKFPFLFGFSINLSV